MTGLYDNDDKWQVNTMATTISSCWWKWLFIGIKTKNPNQFRSHFWPLFFLGGGGMVSWESPILGGLGSMLYITALYRIWNIFIVWVRGGCCYKAVFWFQITRTINFVLTKTPTTPPPPTNSNDQCLNLDNIMGAKWYVSLKYAILL